MARHGKATTVQGSVTPLKAWERELLGSILTPKVCTRRVAPYESAVGSCHRCDHSNLAHSGPHNPGLTQCAVCGLLDATRRAEALGAKLRRLARRVVRAK